jgi:hypothetical protein
MSNTLEAPYGRSSVKGLYALLAGRIMEGDERRMGLDEGQRCCQRAFTRRSLSLGVTAPHSNKVRRVGYPHLSHPLATASALLNKSKARGSRWGEADNEISYAVQMNEIPLRKSFFFIEAQPDARCR